MWNSFWFSNLDICVLCLNFLEDLLVFPKLKAANIYTFMVESNPIFIVSSLIYWMNHCFVFQIRKYFLFLIYCMKNETRKKMFCRGELVRANQCCCFFKLGANPIFSQIRTLKVNIKNYFLKTKGFFSNSIGMILMRLSWNRSQTLIRNILRF